MVELPCKTIWEWLLQLLAAYWILLPWKQLLDCCCADWLAIVLAGLEQHVLANKVHTQNNTGWHTNLVLEASTMTSQLHAKQMVLSVVPEWE